MSQPFQPSRAAQLRSQVGLSTTVGRALLDAGCVKFRTDEPFRLPSGWASPVYIDCRRLISFPRLRRELIARGLEMLRERHCLEGIDAVAGAESSGIAPGAWVAEALDLPLLYVRKEAKGLGPGSQVEGLVAAGDRVLLVDDMMAAARSKRIFCEALSAAGTTVKDIFVLFDYGTFPTQAMLAPWQVTVHSLANWRDVLDAACAAGTVGQRSLDELRAFLDDPLRWSRDHGGRQA
ncbi:orotate phosphoribosyltransferase [Cupriavidus basilensis]|uniref:Orotate phosphoribosyltransferase n=1 Tax=Cupriavidus basilensis TaxID=68895 RepID=A0ABT6AVG1_9BURK|nr:orotate phosphoribosyltransferase [Cupriavidus basilensis]MDF3836454.1 orotate phosphoribosyltransferase [Cupriavidus basilensis]